MKANCSTQKNRALTLVEVLVVLFVIFILAAMLLPASHVPGKAKQIQCVNYLKNVGFAYRLWAGDHNDEYPMNVSVTNGGTKEVFSSGSRFQNLAFLNYLVMSNELSTPRILLCPADTNSFESTNFSTGFGNQNISYLVNLDAAEINPQTILSGDDNFKISGVPVRSGLLELSTNAAIAWTSARHHKQGDIGLVDGSVQELTILGLQQALQNTGFTTNRILIP